MTENAKGTSFLPDSPNRKDERHRYIPETKTFTLLFIVVS